MDGTKIQWTDATLNVSTGCTKVSPGCSNCYIVRTPPFRINGRTFKYQGKALGVTTGVILHPERLTQPLKWTRPRRIFVNSLSDLFHEDVPDEFIEAVFGVMARARQHCFQILTKRPERMLSLLRDLSPAPCLAAAAVTNPATFEKPLGLSEAGSIEWPLPNVWLGTSTENQLWADRRIPLLAQIPVKTHFISAEPLLGPLNLARYLRLERKYLDLTQPFKRDLQWVIIGGESGPGARPFEIKWARELIKQCQRASVPVFMKQLGAVPINEEPEPGLTGPAYLKRQHELDMLWPEGTRFGNPTGRPELNGRVVLLKDKKGGAWDEWPDDLKVREFPV